MISSITADTFVGDRLIEVCSRHLKGRIVFLGAEVTVDDAKAYGIVAHVISKAAQVAP